MTSSTILEQNESFQFETGKIYQQQQLDAKIKYVPTWQYNALNDFNLRLYDQGFPCLFGKKAYKAKNVRFLFCQQSDTGKYHDFLLGLIEYTEFVRNTPVHDRLLCPLIIFFDDSFYHGAKDQHPVAWDALNWVHAHDPKPWPANIPLNPDDVQWCFCFNGVQLFINMSSAIHEKIRSRNLGRYLTLVVNPRENFDVVAGIHTKSGQLIRERIRSRVAVFNNDVVSPELGFYGDAENREWKQYQLSEEGHEQPARCPFHSHLLIEE